MVDLGDQVRDLVTGLVGIVTTITLCLNGCRRIGVQPPMGSDGKHPDAWVIDEGQLEVTIKQKVKAKADRSIGGPPEKAAHY